MLLLATSQGKLMTRGGIISDRLYENKIRDRELLVRCQLIQDCVNHSSRKHYLSGQKDYYYLEEKGKYRLYNSSTDGKWNKYGEKIS